ncbi:MAG: MraY family glycosyltransferase [Acidobacteriota bacterium]
MAIALGSLEPLAGWLGVPAPSIRPLTALLVAAAFVFAVGVWDDVWGLPVWPRLAVQLLASGLVMSSGLLIERVTVFGETWALGWFAWPVTIVWIVGLTNAFNLIDGLDGLAAGVAVIAGAACAAILVARGHPAEAVLLLSLVGSALGFLAYNFAPASVFLGDGGSLLIGFVLANTAITGWQKGATAIAAGVPLMIFALPIADSASALVRRASRRPATGSLTLSALGRQLAEPDRAHIHHRLTALGWSVRRVVLVLYGVTAGLSLLALATAQWP